MSSSETPIYPSQLVFANPHLGWLQYQSAYRLVGTDDLTWIPMAGLRVYHIAA
jgi:hypothetical protein